ncbi:MAG: cellulose synthase complex periplasmic endoglucanase BcsZ [Terracidiphilus sp.]|nr:cellulose synthase complex periplasmic endoglucanase BcsZ [Terracidiphilus sp.]
MSWMAARTGQRIFLVAVLLMISATGGCKERQWKLWNAYSARFIDAQGRVFDPQGDQHTTSEGEAYALFFSLVADDRATFDRVLAWSQANLAGGSLEMRLPAWKWGKSSDGPWKALDANPASDADVWMAYTLVEAGRLWNNPSYSYLGLRMAALIAKNEVVNLPGFGPMLIPGPAGFQKDNNWTLNPSYLPVFLFQRLANADPTGPWASIANGIPRLLAQSSKHGFAMDWVQYVPGDGFYPAAKQAADPSNKDANGPTGSYDAIRVYLWAGMTGGNGGTRSAALEAVPGMSAYLANHGAPPEKVSDQGIPLAQDGPVGFSAALLPYLRAYGQSKEAGDQLVRMNAMRDSASGLYGKDLSYYDQNLALFGTGFLDGRFGFGPGGELKVEWKRR